MIKNIIITLSIIAVVGMSIFSIIQKKEAELLKVETETMIDKLKLRSERLVEQAQMEAARAVKAEAESIRAEQRLNSVMQELNDCKN